MARSLKRPNVPQIEVVDQRPVVANGTAQFSDGAQYRIFSDGSFRRWPPINRGKARRKAAKIARQRLKATR